MMEPLAISSCPFCGKEGFVWDGSQLDCFSCKAVGPRAHSFEQAKVRWNNRSGYIYVASPYSSPCAAVRLSRYLAVKKFVEYWLGYGELVVSPVVYGHHLKVSGSWDFWKALDLDLLNHCSAVWVLKLAGWESSVGVQNEITWAKEHGKEIQYYGSPD